MDFDITRAIPVNDAGDRQPQFDISRAVPIAEEAKRPEGPRKATSLEEAKGMMYAEMFQVIRWGFWRFIEHPATTIVEAAQKPEGKTVGGTLAKAGQAYVPFKKIPKEEYGTYGKVWDNYYQGVLQLKGYARDEVKTPGWYVAMASYGSAMALEPPAIRAVERVSELAATRVATADEAAAVRAHFEPIKQSLKERGLDVSKLHPEGNIVTLDRGSELFFNKYVSAVLRGDEVRIPRWSKIQMPKKPLTLEYAGNELISKDITILPKTGPKVELVPDNIPGLGASTKLIDSFSANEHLVIDALKAGVDPVQFSSTHGVTPGEAQILFDSVNAKIDGFVAGARERSLQIEPTDTINNPDRQKIREDAILRGYDDWAKISYPDKPQMWQYQTQPGAKVKNREAWIVIGAPASGKGQIVDPLISETGAMLIDNDVYKTLIPEYENGVGAAAVHKEAADIIEPEVLERAIENGDNIVIPRLGKNPDKIKDLRDTLIESGYTVHLKLVELDVIKAAIRAVTRYLETGRFVDPEYVKQVGLTPTQTYAILKSEGGFKSYEKYSTDVPKGSKAVRLEDEPGLERGSRGPGNSEATEEVGLQKTPTEVIPPETIRPDDKGITALEKKIAKMESDIDKSQYLRDRLADINQIRRNLRRSIRDYPKGYLKEDMAEIPRYYKSTKKTANTPDQAAQELGLEGDSALVEYLYNLEASRDKILAEIEKPKMVSMKELTYLKDRLQAMRSGYREGAKGTKDEIKAFQETLIDLIEDAGIPSEYRGRYLRKVKNVQTPAQFEKVIGDFTLEVTNLADRVERLNIADAIGKVKAEGIAADYRQEIEGILDKYELKMRSPETLAQRQKTREYVAKQRKEGKDITVPESAIKEAERLTLGEIPIEELRGTLATVKQKAYLGATKQRVREAVYEAEKERIKERLVETAEAINSKPLPEVPIGTTKNIQAERYVKFLNYLRKTRTGLQPMDGVAEVTGMKEVKAVLDRNFQKYLTYNDKYFKGWETLTKDLKPENFERIGAYAILRQEGGAERLANTGKLAEAQKVELTDKEFEAYMYVRKIFDAQFPEIQRYAREVYNEDVGKVDDYVSFLSDFEKMSDLEMYDRFGQRPQEAIGRKTKTVEQGFRMERAKASDIKLELNIDKIFKRHQDDVAYMLTMGRDIKMYSEIINTPEVSGALGDIGALAWKQYMDLMARKGGVDQSQKIATIDVIRRGLGAGVLSYRLSSALVQFSSYGDAMATLGANWTHRGATAIATSKEWRAFIMDNFPEIKKAIADDVAFREFGNGWFQKLSDVGIAPLKALDGMMRTTAAAAAYMKVAAARGIKVNLKKPDPKVIEEALLLVRNSQGSSFYKDQPLSVTTGYGLLEHRSWNKLVLQFQSFMLNRWDNINRQIWRLGIKEKNFNKAFMSLFWLFTFGFAGEEVMRRASRAITKAGVPQKKKEDPFLQDVAFNAFQSVPLMGSLASSIAYSGNPIPALRTFNDTVQGLSAAVTSKTPEARIRGAVQATGGIAAFSGVPGATQGAQLIRERIAPKKKYISR